MLVRLGAGWRVRRSWIVATFLLVIPVVAWAQEQAVPVARPLAPVALDERDDLGVLAVTEADRQFQIPAVSVPVPPQIDGDLGDPIWRTVAPLTEFVQSQPDEGAVPTERTEIRLLYDDHAIYIAAMLYDSEPEQMVATVLRRDESHDANDAFAVTLDTFHDHRNGYFFETNALGARFDAQIIGEGGTSRVTVGTTFNRDWDVVWNAAGRQTDEGWSVEIEIPFWVLRFDPANIEAWGINFRRTIRRKTEQIYWAPIPRQFDATRLSLSGMLVGMQQIDRPRNLRIKPYARGDVGQTPVGPTPAPFSAHETAATGDIGGDVKWNMTPNLSLDGTINTDFAQVEADDVQINLTRFPLFFPEKREFFLENAGLFQFGTNGRGGPRVLGFHSRRVGIYDGEEVPIIAGARLTGKAGGWNIGALDMQTAAVDGLGLPTENHAVVRVRRELGARSSIGTLFTNRQSSSDRYNRQLGFDGRWAINESTTVDGWWMKTWTPGLEGDSSWSGSGKFQWATPEWTVDASAVHIGDIFNPELGFVDRRGVRAYAATPMWTPFFPESTWLRNMTPHVSFSYITDLDNRLLTRRWHFDWDMFLKRGDKLSVAHNRMFEQLDFPFEIVPGVIIDPGAYGFDELQIELQADSSRPVWGRFVYTWGGFWDGTRNNWDVSAGFRTGPRFNFSLALNRNDVKLSGGEFVTDLWRLRIAYDFNTRLFLSGLFQYDDLTDQLQSNVRLNYIYSPGSDIFLVYNERRLREDPTLIDRVIILKVTRLFRI